MLPWGELIRAAFWVALRNRHLWLFGVFAAMPTFSFQVPLPIDGGSSSTERDEPPEMLDPALILVIFVGVLAIGLAFVALSALAQGALAGSVAAIARGEQRGVRAAWREGRASFWRNLGLWVLSLLIPFAGGFALLLAMVVPVLGLLALIRDPAALVLGSIGLAVVVFAVMLPLLFLLAIVVQHAVRELTLRGTRVVESLRGGWRTLRGNFWTSVLLFLIQQGVVVGATFVAGVVVVVLALPAILLLASSAAGATAVAIVTGVIVVPLAVAAYGAIGAFSHAFWTLAYLRLRAKPAAEPHS